MPARGDPNATANPIRNSDLERGEATSVEAKMKKFEDDMKKDETQWYNKILRASVQLLTCSMLFFSIARLLESSYFTTRFAEGNRALNRWFVSGLVVQCTAGIMMNVAILSASTCPYRVGEFDSLVALSFDTLMQENSGHWLFLLVLSIAYTVSVCHSVYYEHGHPYRIYFHAVPALPIVYAIVVHACGLPPFSEGWPRPTAIATWVLLLGLVALGGSAFPYDSDAIANTDVRVIACCFLFFSAICLFVYWANARYKGKKKRYFSCTKCKITEKDIKSKNKNQTTEEYDDENATHIFFVVLQLRLLAYATAALVFAISHLLAKYKLEGSAKGVEDDRAAQIADADIAATQEVYRDLADASIDAISPVLYFTIGKKIIYRWIKKNFQTKDALKEGTFLAAMLASISINKKDKYWIQRDASDSMYQKLSDQEYQKLTDKEKRERKWRKGLIMDVEERSFKLHADKKLHADNEEFLLDIYHYKEKDEGMLLKSNFEKNGEFVIDGTRIKYKYESRNDDPHGEFTRFVIEHDASTFEAKEGPGKLIKVKLPKRQANEGPDFEQRTSRGSFGSFLASRPESGIEIKYVIVMETNSDSNENEQTNEQTNSLSWDQNSDNRNEKERQNLLAQAKRDLRCITWGDLQTNWDKLMIKAIQGGGDVFTDKVKGELKDLNKKIIKGALPLEENENRLLTIAIEGVGGLFPWKFEELIEKLSKGPPFDLTDKEKNELDMLMAKATQEAPLMDEDRQKLEKMDKEKWWGMGRDVKVGTNIDFFMSHSWHDDPKLKKEALEKVVKEFRDENDGRSPTFWLDKTGIKQDNTGTINNCLKVLPVNVMACDRVLILYGKTYPKRLWCIWELFVRFAFAENLDDTMDKIKFCSLESPTATDHIPTRAHPGSQEAPPPAGGGEGLEEGNSLEGLKKFELDKVSCYDPNEEAKLRTIIKAKGRSFFEERIKEISRKLAEREQQQQRKKSLASAMGRAVATAIRLPLSKSAGETRISS